jgi:ring-1,2-phenylacetyl-CoA epoxidase subunit PaaC
MRESLLNYTLHLADSSLIMGHRLSEWTGHGPMLEQDIAMSNIALDFIGQSRNFYQHAAKIYASVPQSDLSHQYFSSNHFGLVTEDTFAYLRDSRTFLNHLITELPNGDWGYTILKLFFFSSYLHLLYEKMSFSSASQLSSIAQKSLKEVAYHRRWSSEWVIRLGDGTEESHSRMEAAIANLWPYTGELFQKTDFEKQEEKEKASTDITLLKEPWAQKVKTVFEEATLTYPTKEIWMHEGGKKGIHTEHLGYILAEMQFLQRAYPGCEW